MITDARTEPQKRQRLEFDASMAKLQPLMERIAATYGLIDRSVYNLYELMQEEIGIVEGKNPKWARYSQFWDKQADLNSSRSITFGYKMSIEFDIPKELELKIKACKELDVLVRRRIERQISKDIKNDVFISMICDDLLKESELDERDVDEIDHKIKREIAEKLRWRS
jgi:hypothetical protein